MEFDGCVVNLCEAVVTHEDLASNICVAFKMNVFFAVLYSNAYDFLCTD